MAIRDCGSTSADALVAVARPSWRSQRVHAFRHARIAGRETDLVRHERRLPASSAADSAAASSGRAAGEILALGEIGARS
jgi:hypothetical protein